MNLKLTNKIIMRNRTQYRNKAVLINADIGNPKVWTGDTGETHTDIILKVFGDDTHKESVVEKNMWYGYELNDKLLLLEIHNCSDDNIFLELLKNIYHVFSEYKSIKVYNIKTRTLADVVSY